MNLPNYFLADLPPEATLSPAMITEACQTLKRNRERYLAGCSTEQLIQTLSDVAEAGWMRKIGSANWRWSKRGTPQQRLGLNRSQTLKLAGTVPGAPGPAFSRATLEKGLDNFSGNSQQKIWRHCWSRNWVTPSM